MVISAFPPPTSPGINPSACIHHSICSNRPENWPRLNLITSVRAAKAWSLRLGHGVRASSRGDVIGGRVLIVPPSPPYPRPCPISHYLITESLFRILHRGSAPSPQDILILRSRSGSLLVQHLRRRHSSLPDFSSFKSEILYPGKHGNVGLRVGQCRRRRTNIYPTSVH